MKEHESTELNAQRGMWLFCHSLIYDIPWDSWGSYSIRKKKKRWVLPPNGDFFFFLSVSSPSQCCLSHLLTKSCTQALEGEKPVKCPSNFDWDVSFDVIFILPARRELQYLKKHWRTCQHLLFHSEAGNSTTSCWYPVTLPANHLTINEITTMYRAGSSIFRD